ncbi:MAG TPA: HNH endonuclease [Jiangellales bacterium]|nr:HNH endonuclease [Jiangellales bacterium]
MAASRRCVGAEGRRSGSRRAPHQRGRLVPVSDGSPPGRAARRQASLARDGDRCLWCGRAFGELVRPTTEHLVPRVKGGPSWSENEAVACHRCNRERGHRTPAEWAEECRGRGWPVDRAVLVRRLEELETAIGIRGGQRRARPYVSAQLRRLRRAG